MTRSSWPSQMRRKDRTRLRGSIARPRDGFPGLPRSGRRAGLLLGHGRDRGTAEGDQRLQPGRDRPRPRREFETSILLEARPELVRDGYQMADHLASERPGLLTAGMSAYTTSGI